MGDDPQANRFRLQVLSERIAEGTGARDPGLVDGTILRPSAHSSILVEQGIHPNTSIRLKGPVGRKNTARKRTGISNVTVPCRHAYFRPCMRAAGCDWPAHTPSSKHGRFHRRHPPLSQERFRRPRALTIPGADLFFFCLIITVIVWSVLAHLTGRLGIVRFVTSGGDISCSVCRVNDRVRILSPPSSTGNWGRGVRISGPSGLVVRGPASGRRFVVRDSENKGPRDYIGGARLGRCLGLHRQPYARVSRGASASRFQWRRRRSITALVSGSFHRNADGEEPLRDPVGQTRSMPARVPSEASLALALLTRMSLTSGHRNIRPCSYFRTTILRSRAI